MSLKEKVKERIDKEKDNIKLTAETAPAFYRKGMEQGARKFKNIYEKLRVALGVFFLVAAMMFWFGDRWELSLLSGLFFLNQVSFNQLWWKLKVIEMRLER